MKNYLATRNVSAESEIPPLAEHVAAIFLVSPAEQILSAVKVATSHPKQTNHHGSSSQTCSSDSKCHDCAGSFPPLKFRQAEFRLAELCPQSNFRQPWGRVVHQAESIELSPAGLRAVSDATRALGIASTCCQATETTNRCSSFNAVWNETLPLAPSCIRCAINGLTDYPPYEVLHGTHTTMPYDSRVRNDDRTKNYFNGYAVQWIIRTYSVHSNVQEPFAETTSTYEGAYDRPARSRTFSVGHQVLIHAVRPPSDAAQRENFYPHGNGQYRVVFAYSNNVSYRLEDPKDPSDTWIEHGNNVKIFLAPRNVLAESGIPPLAETVGDVPW